MNEARTPKFGDICRTAATVNCLKSGQTFGNLSKSSGIGEPSLRRSVKKAGFAKKYGKWRHVSERASLIAARLLESELVRVCAACERERGPVTVGPGQAKSHALCRRHTIEYWGDIGAKMAAEKPDSYFSPDLSKPPESPPETPPKASFYPGAGPSSI